MSRRAVGCRCLILMAVLGGRAAVAPGARAGEDPRTVAAFLQELKAQALHDVALDYIAQLRADPSLPADLKVGLDYEEGRTLIDEAGRSNDLVLREELLRDAKDKLEGFVKAHAERPEARDALVQLAKLLVERGYLALLLGEETQDKAKKDAKLAEARAAFIQAHEAYGKAVVALGAARRSTPSPCPRMTPAARSAMPSTPLISAACSRRASATTSWPRPIRRRPPIGRSTWTRRSSNSRGSTRRTASSGPGWPRRCGRPSASRRRVRSGPQSGCTSSFWSTPILACARSSATSATSTSWPWRSARNTRSRPIRPPTGCGASTAARSDGARRAWACCWRWRRPSTPRCRAFPRPIVPRRSTRSSTL